jgi:hypothetical protein
MKNFASASFFRIFDHKVLPTDLLDSGPSWSVDGVDWTHARHSFGSVEYRHSTDVFIGRDPGKKPWTVMVVREGWWLGQKTSPVRNSQWAHLVAGDRSAALAWFKRQEALPSR